MKSSVEASEFVSTETLVAIQREEAIKLRDKLLAEAEVTINTVKKDYHSICKGLESLCTKGRANDDNKLYGKDALDYKGLIERKAYYDNNSLCYEFVEGIDKQYSLGL